MYYFITPIPLGVSARLNQRRMLYMRQCMDADNLHRRLKKIIGQVQAIDKMIDEDVPCDIGNRTHTKPVQDTAVSI